MSTQPFVGRAAAPRRWRAPLITGALIAATGLVFGGVASASAHDPGHGPGSSASTSSPVPRRGDLIPNVTLVEDQIEAYYGSVPATGPDPIGAEILPSPDGNYAHEVEGIAAKAQQFLAHHATSHGAGQHSGAPAVVFDIDDTTLNTYNYERAQQFGFTPQSNAVFVNAEAFPAVFGMPTLVNWAGSHGYTVFFITGRPEAQRDATVGNLQKVGYTVPLDTTHLFLKNAAAPPAYLSCGSTCTTIQYKSQTRAHIESLGFDIVDNFGDQFSDLKGGHADHTTKLPNPMYFLP